MNKIKNLISLLFCIGFGYIGSTLILKSYIAFRSSELGENKLLIIVALVIVYIAYKKLYQGGHTFTKWILFKTFFQK